MENFKHKPFWFYYLKENKTDPIRVHGNRKGKVFKVEEVEYSAHKTDDSLRVDFTLNHPQKVQFGIKDETTGFF